MGLKEGSEEPLVDDQDDQTQDDQTETTMASDQYRSIEHTETTGDTTRDDVPWKFIRDGAHDGRKQKPIYLQDSTLSAEQDFKHRVETRLGEEVMMADLREAAYLASMENPELVVKQLREWGYDF